MTELFRTHARSQIAIPHVEMQRQSWQSRQSPGMMYVSQRKSTCRQRVNVGMLHGFGAARWGHGACGVHLSVAFVSIGCGSVPETCRTYCTAYVSCTRMRFTSGDTSHLLYGLQTGALSPEVLIHCRARSRDYNMT